MKHPAHHFPEPQVEVQCVDAAYCVFNFNKSSGNLSKDELADLPQQLNTNYIKCHKKAEVTTNSTLSHWKSKA